MANPTYDYAATLRWARRRWVVITAPVPMVSHYFDQGPLGEHVRWWLSPARPRLHRERVMGTETLVPGPWPFRLRVPANLHLDIADIDPLAEVGGLLLALWAIARMIRHPRR